MKTTSTIFEITDPPVIVKIPECKPQTLSIQDVEERLKQLNFRPLSSEEQKSFGPLLQPRVYKSAHQPQQVAEPAPGYGHKS